MTMADDNTEPANRTGGHRAEPSDDASAPELTSPVANDGSAAVGDRRTFRTESAVTVLNPPTKDIIYWLVLAAAAAVDVVNFQGVVAIVMRDAPEPLTWT